MGGSIHDDAARTLQFVDGNCPSLTRRVKTIACQLFS
jgi:hypothetical protein